MNNTDLTAGKDYINISVPKKPEYVSVVRLTASAIASRIGFNIEEIDDIKVAIAEGCTHIIQATQGQESDNFEIEFYIEDRQINIVMKDVGKGLCPSEESADVVEINEGGLGLFIISSLMDEVECGEEQGRLELRMVKRIGVDD